MEYLKIKKERVLEACRHCSDFKEIADILWDELFDEEDIKIGDWVIAVDDDEGTLSVGGGTRYKVIGVGEEKGAEYVELEGQYDECGVLWKHYRTCVKRTIV